MNALRNTCLWLLLLFSPLSTVGGEPETRTDDPTRAERSVTGWVAVEVVGENVVGVAVDAIRDGQKPDGSADYLALFSASQAVPDDLYYVGHAVVDFRRRSLRIVPLDRSAPLHLSVDPLSRQAPADEEERRIGNGLELVYRTDQDFGSVAQAISDLRAETSPGPEWLLVRSEVEQEHQDPPPEAGGGSSCASECSITCAGGGGSCSASCYRTKCASCTCGPDQNLASCSCK